MLLPAVLLPDLEDGRTDTEITRITYLPDEDAFLVEQGPDVTADPESPCEGSVFLTLQQFVQLFEVLNHEDFINAMAMARHDFTRKSFH